MLRFFAPLVLLVLPACPRPVVMCMILEEYDPSAGSAVRLAESPDRLWHPIDMVATREHLYVFGSYSTMSYRFADGEWAALAPPPVRGSVEVRTFLSGSRVLVFGDEGVSSFDTAAGEWKALARYPSKRWYFGAAMHEGKVYLAGGVKAAGVCADLLVYDVGEDSWSDGSPMKNPRRIPILEAVGGKLYAVGGKGERDGKTVELRDVEIFDTETGSWSEGGDCPVEAEGGRLSSAAIGSRIFAINHGGEESGIHELDTLDFKWNSRRTKGLIRRKGAATAMRDGKILILGGFTKEYDVEDLPDGTRRVVFR